MTITAAADKYTAEQGAAEGKALAKRIEEESKGFIEKGREVYAKA